jgi:hypothetical protein
LFCQKRVKHAVTTIATHPTELFDPVEHLQKVAVEIKPIKDLHSGPPGFFFAPFGWRRERSIFDPRRKLSPLRKLSPSVGHGKSEDIFASLKNA